jgi:predicted AAA+ superfamily ATPase
MPEAVETFRVSKSLKSAREIPRSIIQTFRYDFGKYGKKNTGRIDKVFEYIPLHSGEKIKYVTISRQDQAREIRDALDCLIKARVVYPVFHSNCSGLPLNAGIKERVLKCYFMDVGLSAYVQGLEWNAISVSPERLLIVGKLAEQYVAQHLFGRMEDFEVPELFYWLQDGKAGNAEVDFVISSGNTIIPIEVKAGKSGAIRSLHQFMYEKN